MLKSNWDVPATGRQARVRRNSHYIEAILLAT
jgi:hypothetical protein